MVFTKEVVVVAMEVEFVRKNINIHISNIEKLIYIRKEKVVKYLLKFINIEKNNLF